MLKKLLLRFKNKESHIDIKEDKMSKIIQDVKKNLEDFAKAVECKQFQISPEFYPYKESKDMQWPNSDKPGVYIFISDDNNDNPLYIGKSEGHMGKRIWKPLGRIGKGGEELFPDAKKWAKTGREKLCFITIPVDPPRLVPALESFLIYKMESLHNIRR
jgi:hypothetical protein